MSWLGFTARPDRRTIRPNLQGDSHGSHDCRNGRCSGDGKGRHFPGFRRARRRHQSPLRRVAPAWLDRPCAGAPRRGRLAHGRGLHPRPCRQHRRVHRHLGPGGHGHDHGALFGDRRFDPHPVHHRPGAAGPDVQGRLPGGRHRIDREAGHEVGRHGARAGPGAALLPAGLPPDALGPPWPGADRPAVRRADGRDRVRHRHLRAPAGLQAGRDAPPGREGARHAAGGRQAAHRGGRRHHQRRRERAAGRVRRADRRARHSHADGLGHHSRRPSADGRHVRPADQPSLRQCHHARERFRAGHRQPLGQPPHRLHRRVLQGPQVRARRHRAHADRPRVHARLRHRLGCQGRARAVRAGGARASRRRQAARLRRVVRSLRRAQAPDASQEPLRRDADEADARSTRR